MKISSFHSSGIFSFAVAVCLLSIPLDGLAQGEEPIDSTNVGAILDENDGSCTSKCNSGWTTISVMHGWRESAILILEKESSCTSHEEKRPRPELYHLERTHPNYDIISALSIAAFNKGSSVNISYNCGVADNEWRPFVNAIRVTK